MTPDPSIGITHLAANDAWLVHLRGEHDLCSQDDLADVLNGIGPARRIVVDLTDADFIDSTIIGTFIERARDAERAGGSLILAVSGDTPPARVIDLVKLDNVLPVCSSLDEALVSLGATEPASTDPGEVVGQTGTRRP
jgi:anti-anti-sigma factor